MRNETKDALLRDETILKSTVGNYVVYNRKWLFKHLEEEFETLKGARELGTIKPFTKEDFEEWMKQSKEGENNGQEKTCNY